MNHFYVWRGLAHPISYARKYYFTSFFCTNFPFWRPPQSEIRKIAKSHESVFCSHSLYLQNELFPKVVASKKCSTLFCSQSLRSPYLRELVDPSRRGISPSDASGLGPQFELPRHYLRWCMEPLKSEKISKKKYLKKTWNPYIPRRRGVGKSKSITKLFTKIFSTIWHVFFCSQAKKIQLFYASYTLWGPNIQHVPKNMNLCQWVPKRFWDYYHSSWLLWKIHFQNKDRKIV